MNVISIRASLLFAVTAYVISTYTAAQELRAVGADGGDSSLRPLPIACRTRAQTASAETTDECDHATRQSSSKNGVRVLSHDRQMTAVSQVQRELLTHSACDTSRGETTTTVRNSQATEGAEQIAVVRTFPGNTGPGWKQSIDVAGAVGPEHVVDFDVAGFVVHEKSTGRILSRLSSREFWQQVHPAGSCVPRADANDARIIFDPVSDRWFACAAGTTEPDCFLAVSTSPDPLDSWNAVRLPLPQINPYMKLGTDRNGLYVVSCNGHPETSRAADVYVLPKEDAIAAGGPVLTRGSSFTGVHFSAMPATDPDPTKSPDAPMVLLANQFADGICSEVYLYRITWTDSTPHLSEVLTIPLSRAYLTPDNKTPAMEAFQPEPGPKLRAGGGGRRLDSAFIRNGSVFGCNGAKRSADSRPGILWYQVRISDGALLQEGFVDSTDRDFIYPSVAVDAYDNIGIGCTGTSQTEFPSVYVMMHAADDPPGSMRTPVAAVPGTTAYHYAGQRAVNWSHYSATCIDPEGPELLWTLQAFGNSRTDREWCTAWAAVRLSRDTDSP